MTDDLKKQLRDWRRAMYNTGWVHLADAMEAVAHHIEELEAEIHMMKTSGVIEVAVRNPNVLEYIKHWEGRAETAEAKLERAVELVEGAFNEGFGEGMNDVLRQRGGKTWYDSRSRKRLAGLKGETHD